TLQTMKRRIERCRRALLSEMIEITHRRLPLLQVEPPDDVSDRIEGVNEAQLRGYVMLFAAKTPLIANVLLHLDDVFRESGLSEHADNAFRSWKLLEMAINRDVDRLEAAINQSSMDRQLFEEERIRSEQETIAELERLRSR